MPVTLHHRDLGGAGRPPLVILHGLLGSSRNWQAAGRALSERYHVVALDLRGHGQSPHALPVTYEEMAGDVVAWLDARGIGRVSLLGHSMGGKVAMLLACRNPGRVERLLVVDVAPKDYRWISNREAFAAMHGLDLASLGSRAEAERSLAPRIHSAAMRHFLLTNLVREEGGQWKWGVDLPGLTQAVPVLESNPLGPGERFTGPTLFLAGGKSDYVEPGDGDAIRRHFPAARIETLPAAGHNPHVEAREEFVRRVLEG